MDFETREETQDALHILNDLEFLGHHLWVRIAGFRDIDGTSSTGSAQASNWGAWELDELKKKILRNNDRSAWGPPDTVVGLKGADSATMTTKRILRSG